MSCHQAQLLLEGQGSKCKCLWMLGPKVTDGAEVAEAHRTDIKARRECQPSTTRSPESSRRVRNLNV